MTTYENEIELILKKYWGFDGFRYTQKEIIFSVLAGNKTLAVLPTGAGKSLCYQVSGLALGGLTLVISPLIALIKDQVFSLQKRGIPARAIYGGLQKEQINQYLSECISGEISFLFVAPERLSTALFREMLPKLPVTLVCVDETHCISEWGHDFRPPYLKIRSNLCSLNEKVRWLALTATAPPKVQADIITSLGFSSPQIFKTEFDREHLGINLIRTERKWLHLEHYLARQKGSGIVYVGTRNQADLLTVKINQAGFSAQAYHAGLSREKREYVQEAWLTNQCRIVVATGAFGLGVDKPDVRFVVHYDVPPNPEAYIQEIGRAGRDREQAEAVMYVNDIAERTRIRQFYDTYPKVRTVEQMLRSFLNYVLESDLKTIEAETLSELLKGLIPPEEKKSFSARLVQRMIKMLLGLGYIYGSRKDHDTIWLRLSEQVLENGGGEGDIKDMDLIRTMILQTRGNILETWKPIAINKLAQSLNRPESEVRNMIRQGIKTGIFNQRTYTQYTTFGIKAGNQQLESLSHWLITYAERREREQERLQVWLHYLRNDKTCRIHLIRLYLGEAEKEDCWRCDRCLERYLTFDAKEYFVKLLNFIEKESPTLERVKNQLDSHHLDKKLKIFDEFLNEGIVILDENYKLRLKK